MTQIGIAIPDRLRLGAFDVIALEDGAAHMPPSAYPGADFTRHLDLLDETGTYPIRMGAFLVRSPHGVILIDAGAGEAAIPFPLQMSQADGLTNPPEHLMTSGRLPAALAKVGVTPAEIDAVFVTHLHLDHIGWLMHEGKPFFPNATVHYGHQDWQSLVTAVPADDPARQIMEAAHAAGILRPYPSPPARLEGDAIHDATHDAAPHPVDCAASLVGAEAGSEVFPGVRAVPVPGHTPGSHLITLNSDGRRLIFLGDLMEHPGQLTDAGIHFMTDIDRSVAQRARALIFNQARREDIVLVAAHLTNPVFRRVSSHRTWLDATNA
ncbi:glyoxylase-like metal-dependent hydrolase (beta-lactamase superfamily II) [Kineococcus radiotolerans]|uniref:Glyoxylase-like metal-dependent hydrolase (Beta-lactamase superfamily II) n=1 Tax=Kineococcus radiotolerans TaxID=131568 RepID=A0A7W4TQE9_KINRA|nr:MBL fold metallo-hydrolase [Kineococcus radiotolerans]MBB2903215.1 glyoxylase-like metal-dependent hydrolase (beta-lactamase superfamily II) [Kineococcus radiotolerans]